MKNKIIFLFIFILICGVVYSQSSKNLNEALSGKVGPDLYTIDDISYININGLMLNKENFDDSIIKNNDLKLIYDSKSSSANNIVCKIDKNVLVIFDNNELDKKNKKNNALSSINDKEVKVYFLNKNDAKNRFGKKGKNGAVIIEKL